QCMGLGERLSDVNLRGRRHTLFNYSDNLHIPSLDTMYVSIPFLVIANRHRNQYHGIFLDSPAWQSWSLDQELNNRGVVDLLSRRGWSLYIMEADCLPDLIAAYTALTGRSKIPPDWALGHHQSRWSYPDQETLLAVGKRMRESEIPCDCLVLDIDYMDEYRVFTHSKERFPDFKKVIDELDSMGLKTTCILDPGVKKEEKFSVYADGKKRDFFVRRGDQRPFLGKVWPGPSVFPDFLRHDVRVWWSAQHGFFVDNNIAGVWNDMNEPCLIDSPCPMPPQSKELPPEDRQMFMQTLPEGKVGHFEVRNLYGFQMARASFEGLLALRPDERPFVLTRSGYAGVQRYSAVWLGDNMSWWEHLALSVPMLINMGLSGVPFTGVDVGGFGDDCSAELLTRWYELGIFYPFFRNHSSMLGVVQEPWVFGEETEARIRHL
ncbi:MAG TPA: glycoside hydrolase family 31 protein, partial [Candidatus Melainabacteria bacterium]|nr:glycoside hydrolase family 31 protein [Candidatus Melainabacteria bacterium]